MRRRRLTTLDRVKSAAAGRRIPSQTSGGSHHRWAVAFGLTVGTPAPGLPYFSGSCTPLSPGLELPGEGADHRADPRCRRSRRYLLPGRAWSTGLGPLVGFCVRPGRGRNRSSPGTSPAGSSTAACSAAGAASPRHRPRSRPPDAVSDGTIPAGAGSRCRRPVFVRCCCACALRFLIFSGWSCGGWGARSVGLGGGQRLPNRRVRSGVRREPSTPPRHGSPRASPYCHGARPRSSSMRTTISGDMTDPLKSSALKNSARSPGWRRIKDLDNHHPCWSEAFFAYLPTRRTARFMKARG
ncbi:hypothetical protein SUDANB23_06209 (plasmid) [Streptomyces sp. enrichment culture]